MKRLFSMLLALAAIGLAAMPANATLFDRGNGLIYDDGRNITWLKDANYAMTSGYDADGLMIWADAVTWADTLIYGGYSDWRLPATVPQNNHWGYDGTTGKGYNITIGSEMGHMYYTELGNLGYSATDGSYPQPNWGLADSGPFTNLQPDYYWSGAMNTDDAWFFNFYDGYQNADTKDYGFYAWAVRPGDSIAVPEPSALMLMGAGLAGLIATRKRFLRRL